MTAKAFDAGWLALREPVDQRSRDSTLLPLLGAWWSARAGSRVLDLGSGTGSNLRYLAPRLSGDQEWTLFDHDPDLLARVEIPNAPVSMTSLQGDLAAEGLQEIHNADLVTASALLDLASADWVSSLANECSTARCAVLLSLTYDGTIAWGIPDSHQTASLDPDDEFVRIAVNTHQRRDKGLGTALGPTAGALAEDCFRKCRYRTWLRPSPWRLGPHDAELVDALVEGWVGAAVDECPAQADRIHEWARRRRPAITDRNFRLTVGHVDLLALPTQTHGA